MTTQSDDTGVETRDPGPSTGRKVKPKAKKIKAKANGSRKAKKSLKAKAERKVDLSRLDQFGFRLGSKKSKAASLYAKPKGATLAEIKKALRSVQFNLLTELESKGYKIKRELVAGGHGRNITRFHIVV